MSRLYFHSEHSGTAAVLGAERAHIGLLVRRTAEAALPSSYLAWHRMTLQARDVVDEYQDAQMRLWFGSSGDMADPMFMLPGKPPLKNYHVALNTVLALGSDVLCMFARLDGQCEHHAYVEGPNRVWLANVI